MRLCACGVVLWAAVASAQVPVKPNTPLVVAWDAPPEMVDGYRCYLDGVQAGADLSASARACPIPAVATGTHTIGVTSFNTFGESGASTLAITVGPPPAPGVPARPTNLRIVQGAASGDRQSIPPLTSITAPDGATWTLQGTTLLRNGTAAVQGPVTQVVVVGGEVYMLGVGGIWYRWASGTWVSHGTVAP